MKMTKIIALLLSVFMIVTMFAACGKSETPDVDETTPETEAPKDPKEVLKEAIVANPQQAIADAMVLALAESAPEGMAGESKAIKYDFKMGYNYEDEYASLQQDIVASLVFDPSTMAAALTASLNNKQVIDGITSTETMDGSAYLKGSELAVKSDILTEYFGTDCVGVDLDITKDTIVNSNLYKALPELLGVTEDELTEMMDSIDLDTLITAVKTYVTGVKDLYATAYVASAPVEEKVMINGTEVECFVVTYTLSETVVDDLVGLTVKLIEDLSAVIEETEYTEEDLKEMVESLSDSMPTMEMESKYYVSVATGALVKVDVANKVAVDDGYGDIVETTQTFDITFGADPTADFLPAFKMELSSGYDTITFTGETVKEDGKTIFSGEIVATTAYDDESEPYVDTVEYKFVLNADNTFEATFTNPEYEETYTFKGTMKVEGNKFTVVLDLSELAVEDFEVPSTVELSVTFGAEMPEMPEYKSIFDFTAEDIAAYVPAE